MPRDPNRPTIASPAEPGSVRGWFAFLGGAIAWTAHILLSYAIAEFGCTRGLHHTQLAGITLTAWLLIMLTVLMFLLAVAAAWAGWPQGGMRPAAQLDRSDAEDDEKADPRATASDHLRRTGALLSGLFAIIILAQAVPLMFYLHRC
ncbi:MAG: hypothetical protein WD079_03415 [Phycisphaeraceae bacterium]